MKPEKQSMAGDLQEFREAGVREELPPLLQKLNIISVDQLREIKPSKLLNDIGGLRKKLKLDSIAAITLPEIESWQKK